MKKIDLLKAQIADMEDYREDLSFKIDIELDGQLDHALEELRDVMKNGDEEAVIAASVEVNYLREYIDEERDTLDNVILRIADLKEELKALTEDRLFGADVVREVIERCVKGLHLELVSFSSSFDSDEEKEAAKALGSFVEKRDIESLKALRDALENLAMQHLAEARAIEDHFENNVRGQVEDPELEVAYEDDIFMEYLVMGDTKTIIAYIEEVLNS